MDGSNDMLISSTLTSNTDNVPSCDSAQYHFHIMTHPALVRAVDGSSQETKRQTYYKSINEFDISEDGTRLFLDVSRWDGAKSLMQMNITTPWDLSTIEPFDYYDSASATSNGGDAAYSGDSDYWAYRTKAMLYWIKSSDVKLCILENEIPEGKNYMIDGKIIDAYLIPVDTFKNYCMRIDTLTEEQLCQLN